jgi:hypothetical protein
MTVEYPFMMPNIHLKALYNINFESNIFHISKLPKCKHTYNFWVKLERGTLSRMIESP